MENNLSNSTENTQEVNTSSDSTPDNTPSPTSQFDGYTDVQFETRAKDLDSKLSDGGELSDEDLAFHDAWTARIKAKEKKERDLINGNIEEEAPVLDENGEPIEGEENLDPNKEEKEPTGDYKIPEDHAELYKLTGAKNPKELFNAHVKNLDRLEQAMEWKNHQEARVKEMEDNHEIQLNNAADLLAEVIQGNEEAIEHAKSLLVKANRNPYKPREIRKEDFLTEAEYLREVQREKELTELREARARDQEERKAQAMAVKAEQIKTQALTEVSNLAEMAKDLGLSPAQARAVFNELEEKRTKANLPPMAMKFKQVYDIAVSKAVSFEDAYAIYSHKNFAARVKEEVARLTGKKGNSPAKPVGLNHVKSKAQASAPGKYSQEQVNGFAKTGKYPDGWVTKDGNFNPNLPDYIMEMLDKAL